MQPFSGLNTIGNCVTTLLEETARDVSLKTRITEVEAGKVYRVRADMTGEIPRRRSHGSAGPQAAEGCSGGLQEAAERKEATAEKHGALENAKGPGMRGGLSNDETVREIQIVHVPCIPILWINNDDEVRFNAYPQ